MNCQECELALGLEESTAALEEHLTGCGACRVLAEEVRANAAAFEAMGNELMPGVRAGVMAAIRRQTGARQVLRWGWALAAVAGVVAMIGVSRNWREEKLVIPPAKVAGVPANGLERPDERVFILPAVAHKEKVQKRESLMVKMLTDDPDVVIYWEIETKEGTR